MLCADCQASWQKTWITAKMSETAAWPRFFPCLQDCQVRQKMKKGKRISLENPKSNMLLLKVEKILDDFKNSNCRVESV